MITILGAIIQSASVGLAIVVVEELLRVITTRAAKRAGAGSTVVRDIGTSFRLVGAIAIVSAVLSVTGVASEFTTLTLSGIGALAVSLALQTTLSNVISGFLLFHDGAIRLHDQIEYGGAKGKIVRIALRNTWIKTESGSIVIVSNSSLAGGPLTNHSATERLSKRYAIQ